MTSGKEPERTVALSGAGGGRGEGLVERHAGVGSGTIKLAS